MENRFPFKIVIMIKRVVKHVIIANGIINGIYSAPYILLYVMRREKRNLICLMLENTECLCYSKFVFVRFDLLSNFHDQKEYDNYFVISREANMLATLKIKIEIIYSLVNLCGKNKHRYPSTKQKYEKKQRIPTA